VSWMMHDDMMMGVSRVARASNSLKRTSHAHPTQGPCGPPPAGQGRQRRGAFWGAVREVFALDRRAGLAMIKLKQIRQEAGGERGWWRVRSQDENAHLAQFASFASTPSPRTPRPAYRQAAQACRGEPRDAGESTEAPDSLLSTTSSLLIISLPTPPYVPRLPLPTAHTGMAAADTRYNQQRR
jgi:hypothetical protein